MNTLPTIVLVPGAFHVRTAMDLLSEQLREIGFSTQSFGLLTTAHPQLTIKDDAAALTTEGLLPLIEKQDRDVVLYLHSYAGFPGSTAIKGLSKTERLAAGKRGGIIGLIYQAAFIPKPGDTLLQLIGGQYAPWQAPDIETGLVSVIDPKATFYADVMEPLATEAVSELCPQSLLSMHTPSGDVFYGIDAYNKRRTYLHCNKDQALPPFAQDALVAESGVEWDVQKIDTSHSPFFSEPKQLADIVVSHVKAFIATY
ncbi:MAG: hypothetical protein LQ350_007312 [Teloschistes chrysophthalmus]|nr:MAG: hypothetical protein LQ350_007312 [Niorma chrysophthalma]